GHVGGCRRLLAFVFQWSAAERAVGRCLGLYRHSGILRRRVASSKWSLTLLAARLLGIVDAALFGKWSSLTMLGPFQPLVLFEKFGILSFQFPHQSQQLFPAQLFDRRLLLRHVCS